MRLVFFDTETTGLDAKSQVVQFSAVCCSFSDFGLTSFENFYCRPTVFVSREAQKVTGLTNSKLEKLSDGLTFEDHVQKRKEFFYSEEPTIYIGYNINFDKKLINQTLKSFGCKPIDFGFKVDNPKDMKSILTSNFCLMTYLKNKWEDEHKKKMYRGYKLSDMIAKYFPNDYTQKMYKDFLNHISYKGEANFHDSLYDAFCTYLLFLKVAKDF